MNSTTGTRQLAQREVSRTIKPHNPDTWSRWKNAAVVLTIMGGAIGLSSCAGSMPTNTSEPTPNAPTCKSLPEPEKTKCQQCRVLTDEEESLLKVGNTALDGAKNAEERSLRIKSLKIRALEFDLYDRDPEVREYTVRRIGGVALEKTTDVRDKIWALDILGKIALRNSTAVRRTAVYYVGQIGMERTSVSASGSHFGLVESAINILERTASDRHASVRAQTMCALGGIGLMVPLRDPRASTSSRIDQTTKRLIRLMRKGLRDKNLSVAHVAEQGLYGVALGGNVNDVQGKAIIDQLYKRPGFAPPYPTLAPSPCSLVDQIIEDNDPL